MTIKANRAVLAHPWLTGLSQRHLATLIEELAHPWETAVEGHWHRLRGGKRKRAAGAGARNRLVFVDRLTATSIHLRHDLPHAVLGLLLGVERSTITRAVGQIRALLAERGGAVPNRAGVRLRTLEDVFAYAQAEGVQLRLDATAVRTEGIDACFRYFPQVEVLLDDGYLGLRRDHAGKAITPPRKPNKSALPEFHERWKHHRHAHSSDRITVEHALADHKRWKQLVRWTHRRENLPTTYRAIAGLVSDRTANI